MVVEAQLAFGASWEKVEEVEAQLDNIDEDVMMFVIVESIFMGLERKDVMDPRGVFKLAGEIAMGDPSSGGCKEVGAVVTTAGKHSCCNPICES